MIYAFEFFNEFLLAARNRADGPGAAAASGGKRYDPSKIYGAPVPGRRSKENR